MLRILTIIFVITLVGCLHGDNSIPPETPVGSVSGLAYDGLIINGVVSVYGWQDGTKGELLGETVTNDAGEYSLSFQSTSQPVLLEVTGGFYVEEFSNNQVYLTSDKDRLSAIVNYGVGDDLNISVTLFTHVAAGFAEYLVTLGTPVQESIATAHDMINDWLGFDVAATTPIDITDPANATFRMPNGYIYGMTTAAISYYTATICEQNNVPVHEYYNSITYAQLLYLDIVYDGLLDGIGDEGELSMGIVPLARDDLRHLLAVNLLAMAGHENNKTRLGPDRFVEHAQALNSFSFASFKADATKNITTDAPVFVSTSLDNNNVIAGDVTFSADIEDPVGLKRVEFIVDNFHTFIANDLKHPMVTANSFLLGADGEHELRIVAENTLGNTSTKTISIYLANRGTVVVDMLPVADSIVRGSIKASAKVVDTQGFESIQFYIDTGPIETTNNGLVTATIDTTKYRDGAHELRLLTVNNAGYMHREGHFLQIDNTQPVLNITSPSDMQIVKTTVPLEFDVSDVNGLESVRVFLNGNEVATEGNITTLERDFDISALSDGTHRLSVEAKDNAGNITIDSREFYVRNVGTSIEFVGFNEGDIVNEPFTIEAIVSDPVGVSKTYIDFDIFSEELAKSSTNPKITYDNLNGAQGNRGINLRTINNYGVEVSASTFVIVDSIAPVISINTPTHMQSVTGGVLNLNATVDDTTNLQQVNVWFVRTHSVIGKSFTQRDLVFSWTHHPVIEETIDLTDYFDSYAAIEIEAIDSAGNRSLVRRELVIRNNGTQIDFLNVKDGDLIGTTGSFQASVFDSLGITDSWMQLDNGALHRDGTPELLEWDYDLRLREPGNHTLTVTTFNGLEERVEKSITITLDNVFPVLTHGLPDNDTYHSNDLTFSIQATDETGVRSVELIVDGEVLETYLEGTENIAVSINTRPFLDTTHTLQIRVTDVAGNVTESDVRTVYFDNTAPTISISNPVGGAMYDSNFKAIAQVDEALVVTYIEFFIDGKRYGGAADPKVPEGRFVIVNVKTFGDGQHTMYAIATDGAGNQTTSETVIFHIDQTPPLLVNKSIDNSGAYACAVNFEVTDSASGIESLVLGASDGTFISSRSSTIGAVIKGSKVDELGIFRTIALYAYDNAGNHTVYSFCMEHYYNKTPIGIPDVFSCKFSSSGCGLG